MAQEWDIGKIGIGPTQELSLRVSAAALVRVTFLHPETGNTFLALERKATLVHQGEQNVVLVSVKPYGGGVRINRPAWLLEHIAGFHFDSPRSRDEQDFRILIRPADWEMVKQFCLGEFRAAANGSGAMFLEADPVRELAEEFADTLQVTLSPEQYRLKPLGILVENEPVETENHRATHQLTVRIYTIFEAALDDSNLIRHLLAKSRKVSDLDLTALAVEDARKGGRGRANAVLALPVDLLTKAYLDLEPLRRNTAIVVEGLQLEGNVPAVLKEVPVPKYEWFSL